MSVTVAELAGRRRISQQKTRALLESMPEGVVVEVEPGRWAIAEPWRDRLAALAELDPEDWA